MRSGLLRYWPLWLACLGLAAPAWGQSAQISSELQVQQVETVGGNTVFKPAQVSKPGDVLEYRVSYTNHSAAAVTGLIASLPIPAGTTLLERSQLQWTFTGSLSSGAVLAVSYQVKIGT